MEEGSKIMRRAQEVLSVVVLRSSRESSDGSSASSVLWNRAMPTLLLRPIALQQQQQLLAVVVFFFTFFYFRNLVFAESETAFADPCIIVALISVVVWTFGVTYTWTRSDNIEAVLPRTRTFFIYATTWGVVGARFAVPQSIPRSDHFQSGGFNAASTVALLYVLVCLFLATIAERKSLLKPGSIIYDTISQLELLRDWSRSAAAKRRADEMIEREAKPAEQSLRCFD